MSRMQAHIATSKPRKKLYTQLQSDNRSFLLAHDPGTANYGIAVISFDLSKKNFDIKIHYSSRLVSTFRGISQGTNLHTNTHDYLQEVQVLLKAYPIDIQIAERFMMRTAGGALTIELVNQMLGALRLLCCQRKQPIKLIPSSQWKNPLKRLEVDLPSVYKSLVGVTAHQLDAALIGVFGICTLAKIKPFSMPGFASVLKSVIDQLHKLEPTNPNPSSKKVRKERGIDQPVAKKKVASKRVGKATVPAKTAATKKTTRRKGEQ